MTTKQQTMTAAEARALADRLAAEEQDLTARKRAADRAAQGDACRAEFTRVDTELQPLVAAALAHWHELRVSDDATLEDLFTAWNEARRASAVRFATLSTANGTLGSLEPRRHEMSGQPIGHRGDVHDTLVESSFTRALETYITDRAERARDRAIAETHERVRQAGAAAAEAVK